MDLKDEQSKKYVPSFDPDYHRRQWDTCYENTKEFLEFLKNNNLVPPNSTQTVVDLCCGSGANLYWIKQQFPNIKLTGIDVVRELVQFGNQELVNRGIADVDLIEGDVYALEPQHLGNVDGVIALQTISWLPDEVGFIKAATSIDPEWIAITGLMMPGSRSFRCLVNNDNDPDGNVNYYNTFSIPYLQQLFEDHGYSDFRCEPFNIGIDLERPMDVGSGTYTEKTEDGRRLQISGAILMNWCFLSARKSR